MTRNNLISGIVGRVATGAAIAGLSVSLVACGASGQGEATDSIDAETGTAQTTKDDEKKASDDTKTDTDATGGSTAADDGTTTGIDIGTLRSDGTKLVYKEPSGTATIVFTYQGDAITGETLYTDYGDPSLAQLAADALMQSQASAPDETIKDIRAEGTKTVIEYTEKQYGGMTVSDVKTAYSYLEEQV